MLRGRDRAMTDAAFPGGEGQQSSTPTDEAVESEPVGDDDMVVAQEPSGTESLGGGEFPDRDTPPNPAAGGGATS